MVEGELESLAKQFVNGVSFIGEIVLRASVKGERDRRDCRTAII